MRILVTGAKGMLGTDLCRIFAAHHEVVATDIEEMDVRDPVRVSEVAADVRPDLIMHLAAATEVDECERDLDWAYHTNAIGTRNVALACQEAGAVMCYISTISVFDGTKQYPYTEFDTPNPQSVYSRSKYEGERFVRALLNRFFVVRAGWMYGGWAQDKKFVAKILELARHRPALQIVDDKFGSPTYTVDMSTGLLSLMATNLYGTYHMVGTQGFCSRYEFAQAILQEAGIDTCELQPVSSARFPLPAPRPRMEAALNYHLELQGMNTIRPWREALSEYVQSLIQEEVHG